MKLLVSLAVLTVLVLALVEAKPRKNGGGDAGGRRRFGSIGGRSRGDCPRGGPIACRREEADGTVLEEETCPESYECTNGPLDLTIDGSANKIYFCNTPYPNLGMSCKIEDITGSVLRNKTCPDGNQCTAGPYDGTYRRTNAAVKFYICVPTGYSGNPTEPNYAQSLLRGACNIDGTAQPDHDCRSGVCDGVKVTVARQEAQFCKGAENKDNVFEYLDLFGKYGKRKGSHGRSDSSSAADDEDDSSPQGPTEWFQTGTGGQRPSGRLQGDGIRSESGHESLQGPTERFQTGTGGQRLSGRLQGDGTRSESGHESSHGRIDSSSAADDDDEEDDSGPQGPTERFQTGTGGQRPSGRPQGDGTRSESGHEISHGRINFSSAADDDEDDSGPQGPTQRFQTGTGGQRPSRRLQGDGIRNESGHESSHGRSNSSSAADDDEEDSGLQGPTQRFQTGTGGQRPSGRLQGDGTRNESGRRGGQRASPRRRGGPRDGTGRRGGPRDGLGGHDRGQ